MDSKTFSNLFKVDSPGRWGVVTSKFPQWYSTEPEWESHLSGDTRICRTPIGGDNTCYFGALDFDAKKDSPAIPAIEIYDIIEKHNLPVNLFYSKSKKGCHGYLFSKKPIPAADMRASLKLYSWVFDHLLGEGNDIEIFPKQDVLDGDGNCINLPLYGDSCQMVAEEDIRYMEHSVLPPCLAKLPLEGDRNNFFYHLAVFMSFHRIPDPAKILYMINDHHEIDPLTREEIHTINRSAARFTGIKMKERGGFGLGCNQCPAPRKKHCNFAGQQAVAEIVNRIMLEIMHSYSGDSLIRIHCDNVYIDIARDVVRNYQYVSDMFILDMGIADFPIMKKADWTIFINGAMRTAVRIEGGNPQDITRKTMKVLEDWAPSFGATVDEISKGTPVFAGPDNILVSPIDLNHRMAFQGNGAKLDKVIAVLAHYGEATTIEALPGIPMVVYKISRHTLGLDINDNAAAVVLGPEQVETIKHEIRVEPGPTARFFDKHGRWITFTNGCYDRYPELTAMLEANTLGEEFQPPMRFDYEGKKH